MGKEHGGIQKVSDTHENSDQSRVWPLLLQKCPIEEQRGPARRQHFTILQQGSEYYVVVRSVATERLTKGPIFTR